MSASHGPGPSPVEQADEKVLPPSPGWPHSIQPGSPALRSPVALPRGRRLVIAVDHDGCAERAVHYACKLLLKSSEDRVQLVHVPQKGHPPASSSPHPSGGAHKWGASLLARLSPSGPSSPSQGDPSTAAPGTSNPGGWQEDAAARSGGPASSSSSSRPGEGPAQRGGSARGSRAAAAQAGQQAQQGLDQGSTGQEEAGCRELLELCWQQLLAGSKWVQPERVTARLLPASKSPEKAIANLCTQEGCDILVLGSRGRGHGQEHGHGLPGMGKLLSKVGGGGGTSRYCREHLSDARVVVVRPAAE